MDEKLESVGDERPDVHEILKSMNWEARLEEARARRKEVLARKKPARAQKQAPGPTPEIDSQDAVSIVFPAPSAPDEMPAGKISRPSAAPATLPETDTAEEVTPSPAMRLPPETSRRPLVGSIALGFGIGLGLGVTALAGVLAFGTGLFGNDAATELAAAAPSPSDTVPMVTFAPPAMAPAVPDQGAIAGILAEESNTTFKQPATAPARLMNQHPPAPTSVAAAIATPLALATAPVIAALDPGPLSAGLRLGPEPGFAPSTSRAAFVAPVRETASRQGLPTVLAAVVPEVDAQAPLPLTNIVLVASEHPRLRPAAFAAPPAGRRPEPLGAPEGADSAVATAPSPADAVTVAWIVPDPAVSEDIASRAAVDARAPSAEAPVARVLGPAFATSPLAEPGLVALAVAPPDPLSASDLARMKLPDPATYRIHMHVPRRVPDGEVAGVTESLADAGVPLSPVSRVPYTISENQVRYFHTADAASATVIAELIGARARDFTSFRPSPPDGTLEVFLAGPGSGTTTGSRPTRARSEIEILRDRLVRQLRRGDHL